MKTQAPISNNLLRKIPIIRRLYYNYLCNWVNDNPNAEVYFEITDSIEMLLTVKDWLQKNLFIHGFYEKPETEFWKNATQNKMTIFDIGANVGYFSLLASKRILASGVIYAFEPVSYTYNRAKINIELNGIKNILLNKLALTDSDKQLTLNIGNEENWGMSSINATGNLSLKSEIVSATSVDKFVIANNITQIDLVKIDVEGCELFTLKGMENTIDKMQPVILIEVLDDTLIPAGSSKEEVFKFLIDKHYTPYKIRNGRELLELTQPISNNGLVCFYPAGKPFDKFIKLV